MDWPVIILMRVLCLTLALQVFVPDCDTKLAVLLRGGAGQNFLQDKDLKKRNEEIFSRIETDLRWPQNQRRESTKLLLFSPNNWESKHLHVYCLSLYLYCIQKYIWEEICWSYRAWFWCHILCAEHLARYTCFQPEIDCRIWSVIYSTLNIRG